MKERGIIFSAPMVRELLLGGKTQTRRLVDPPVPPDRGLEIVPHDPAQVPNGRWCARLLPIATGSDSDGDVGLGWRRCPYGQPGARLWVREKWAPVERRSDMVDGIRFAADDAFVPIANTPEAADKWVDAANNDHSGRWRSPLYLPRWAARIVLEITEVRVQRLQEITPNDAIAEGAVGVYSHQTSPPPRGEGMTLDEHRAFSQLVYQPGRPALVGYFAVLWDKINAERAPWASNPWVWALSFRRVEAPAP